MPAELLYAVEDAVAVVTLNRPEKLNAVTADMAVDYLALLAAADADPAVRAVVVTGAGRGFCAGVDLALLADLTEGRLPADDPPGGSVFPGAIRKPLIGAVNGVCAGLGFVIALSCDLRFASHGATFTTAFARLGLVAEYGISWQLPRLVGPAAALDLLMSGRSVHAAEALDLGLVQRVDEDALAAAVGYARGLAETASPRSMAVIKEQVYRDLDRTRAEATAAAMDLMRESLTWPDLPAGLAALTARRRPEFPPL